MKEEQKRQLERTPDYDMRYCGECKKSTMQITGEAWQSSVYDEEMFETERGTFCRVKKVGHQWAFRTGPRGECRSRDYYCLVCGSILKRESRVDYVPQKAGEVEKV